MRRWCASHGVTPPYTAEEQDNLERNRRYILDRQIKALQHKAEVEKLRADRTLQLVNRSANG